MTDLDWPATGAMLQGIAAMLAAGAAVVTCGAAVAALSTWRQETIGRRKVELAEEILATSYEAVETVRSARSFIGFSDEGASFQVPAGTPEDVKGEAQSLWATGERLSAKLEFWGRLEALRYRARPYFGEQVSSAVLEILKVRGEAMHASAALARNALRPGLGVSDRMREKLEAIIWDSEEPQDQMRVRLDAAMATLETVCGLAITTKSS